MSDLSDHITVGLVDPNHGLSLTWNEAHAIALDIARRWHDPALDAALARERRLREALTALVNVMSETMTVADKTWPRRHDEALQAARAALAETSEP